MRNQLRYCMIDGVASASGAIDGYEHVFATQRLSTVPPTADGTGRRTRPGLARLWSKAWVDVVCGNGFIGYGLSAALVVSSMYFTYTPSLSFPPKRDRQASTFKHSVSLLHLHRLPHLPGYHHKRTPPTNHSTFQQSFAFYRRPDRHSQ